MIEGMSYLQLYYNKACTRELEKDSEGNYVYNYRNFSVNAVMPFKINLWCKNTGTHNAYEVSVFLLDSNLEVLLPDTKERIRPNEVTYFDIGLVLPNKNPNEYNVKLRLEYDNI